MRPKLMEQSERKFVGRTYPCHFALQSEAEGVKSHLSLSFISFAKCCAHLKKVYQKYV